MKKIISILLSAVLCVSLIVPYMAGNLTVSAEDASDVIVLYNLAPSYQEYISIPSEYPTSYQLDLGGATIKSSYCTTYDNCVDISSDGLVTPAYQAWYYYGNIGYSSPIAGQEPDQIVKSAQFGTCTYRILDSKGIYTYYNFEVRDYASIYAERAICKRINECVTPNMTDLEKITEAAKMAASYEYSPYYSSATGMIVTGGGDCWASTDLIIQFCKKLGIDAWSRAANRYTGGGSGHRNAIAKTKDGYYVIEAGYYESAPRSYYIWPHPSLFNTIYNTDDTVKIYQYDAKVAPVYIDVPEEVNGKTVDGLDEYALNMSSGTIRVLLPPTITSIDANAIYSYSDLEDLYIPASVTSIDDKAVVTYNENLVIYGEKGSQAETYANEHGFKFTEGKPGEIEILSQSDEDITVEVGESVTLSVDVGRSDVTYRWMQNTGAWNFVTGANSPELTVNNITYDTAYRCIVSDSTGKNKGFSKDINITVTRKQAAIDSTNFPDPIFREYVSRYDTDKNDKLSQAETDCVTSMDVSSKGIADLKGIEYFTELHSLDVSGNNIAQVDVSQFMWISSLKADNNIYDLGAASDTYPIKNIPGFVPERASNWQGAEYDANTKSLINFTSPTVTFTYNCGNGYSESFTLKFSDIKSVKITSDGVIVTYSDKLIVKLDFDEVTTDIADFMIKTDINLCIDFVNALTAASQTDTLTEAQLKIIDAVLAHDYAA
ncbi:MAG: hypothetical protein ACI4JK_07860 [Oscillospiraceae bacterium]